MTIQRLRVQWSGDGVVGPGLTTFYGEDFASVSAIETAVAAFFNGVKTHFPTGITWTIPSGGDLINESNGALVGSWGGPGITQVVSSGAGAYAAGVGARIQWVTQGIVGGRRVRGSTFLVPLTTGQYDSNGTIANATVLSFQTAADALVSAMNGELLVWSRPTGTRVGQKTPVTAAIAPDKVSWLRSRRV